MSTGTVREGKSFAALSGSLLARKGEARPAMRRQAHDAGLGTHADDLGWNDMGEEPGPGAPAVVRQQAAIAREFAGPAEGRRSAFTLRLDADRHLRLRLVCAARHRSAQQIVIQALDELLARMPEAERLAASLAAGDLPGADSHSGGKSRS